jgi:hypothetical protein
MKDNDFPIGNPTYEEFHNKTNLLDHIDLFGHFYADIKAPDNLTIPILQIHHNNRTVSPLGKFKGWFFSPLFFFIKKK